jgi:uncharacterized membrane protein YqhA
MREQTAGSARPADPSGQGDKKPAAPAAELIGHTRFIVLIGVVAVLVISATLFIFGAMQAATSVWGAIQGALQGRIDTTELTITFLEIISTMLKAVVFYIIGVGLYSLFIAPLNLPVALGVETLFDLEGKVASIIVVIMAITFLEHFIQWQQPTETLQFGIAFALAVAVLVLFQWNAHREKEALTRNSPAIEERAHLELFSEGRERRDVSYEEYRQALDSSARASEGERSAGREPAAAEPSAPR